jgi:hypothetical protein
LFAHGSFNIFFFFFFFIIIFVWCNGIIDLNQLGELTATVKMPWSWNQFSGSLPTQLGRLTSMTSTVELDNIDLNSTSLPTEIFNMVLLTSNFELSNNNISGTLPSEVGRLTAFKSDFVIVKNQFRGAVPTEVRCRGVRPVLSHICRCERLTRTSSFLNNNKQKIIIKLSFFRSWED